MTETWLKTNRRALAFGLLLPDLLLTAGVLLLLLVAEFYVRLLAGLLVAVGLAGMAGMLWQMRRPRLAYQEGRLLVFARSGAPYRVPIEHVEGFLLGQGPSMLPGRRNARLETSTLVVRLADSAADWAERDVHRSIGKWCGGYITLRGTWCEPLSLAVVQRLNTRLAEVTGRTAGSGAAP